MDIEANFIVKTQVAGKFSFIYRDISENSDLYVDDIESTMKTFEKHFNEVYRQLKIHSEHHLIIEGIKSTYLAIMEDKSFKENIQKYLLNNFSLSTALLGFYENKVLPVFNARIAKEIFNLLVIINDPYQTRENNELENIIVTRDLTIKDWLAIDIHKIKGLILIDQSPSSHSCQIALSLNISTAIIYSKDYKMALNTFSFIRLNPYKNIVEFTHEAPVLEL
jgi:phosphoenolpyruvate-protein kinase (PTS system EI component)